MPQSPHFLDLLPSYQPSKRAIGDSRSSGFPEKLTKSSETGEKMVKIGSGASARREILAHVFYVSPWLFASGVVKNRPGGKQIF